VCTCLQAGSGSRRGRIVRVQAGSGNRQGQETGEAGWSGTGRVETGRAIWKVMRERTACCEVRSGTEVRVKGAYILVELMGVTECERETGCDYQVTKVIEKC